MKNLTFEEKQEVHQAFSHYDDKRTGLISVLNALKALQSLGITASVEELAGSRWFSDSSLHEVDLVISFKEFYQFAVEKLMKRDQLVQIVKAFRTIDFDNSGMITYKNLKKMSRELGEDTTEAELNSMIDEFDKDGDGTSKWEIFSITFQVDLEEFITIMSGTV